MNTDTGSAPLCSDCPDHEWCMTGGPCDVAKAHAGLFTEPGLKVKSKRRLRLFRIVR